MSAKSTWFWAVMAAALFAFIFFFERHVQTAEPGPAKVLSSLRANEITAVSVTPGKQLAIRVQRTNDAWQLTQPLVYPAQSDRVEKLLEALEKLTSASPPLTAAELRKRSKADEEYGFSSPQVTLILYHGDEPTQILLGSRTAPGDQVFLRVVGVEDIFIVDAGILNLLPGTVDDWRDHAFADVAWLAFNCVTVTSGGNVFELQRLAANLPWRITRPTPSRADNAKVQALLQKLPALRVNRFVEDTRADLDTFGLQPPDLELRLSQDTNTVLDLLFGKSPTNDTTEVFARREDRKAIVTVTNDQLNIWHSAFENLRDRHLLSLARPFDSIEVHGTDNFTLQRGSSNVWWVQPQNFLADSIFTGQLITNLSTLQVTQFVRDVVPELDLPIYGLAAPARQFIVKATRGPDDPTNASMVQLDFGITQDDRVYVRRTDEDSVYAITLADFQRLPPSSLDMRDRRVWNFSADDVADIVIHQSGRARKIIHNGQYEWALAPGSSGTIEGLAIEENTKNIGQLKAAVWTDRGEQNLLKYGITTNSHRVTVSMKNGQAYTVTFGNKAPSQFPYAAVQLAGGTWIFEFPWDLYQYVLMYFSAPLILP